jgi:hypothetical protein
LPAGSLWIDNQDARDIHRDFPPCVLLDQRKRQINSRGYPGGRPNRTVADEDRIGPTVTLG